MMSEFQRQHPASAISGAFALIRENFVTILIFLFLGVSNENLDFLWWISGGFIVLLLLGFGSWWRFEYKIENGELHIRRGLFVRKNLYLTKDRIQVIDITAGLVQRLFGLVKVDIQTAGSSSREASIEAVSLQRAKEINRLLRGETDSSDAGESEEISETIDKPQKIFTLPGKELLIAASTSGSFGIAFSILATVFSQAEPLLDESEMYDIIIGLLPAQNDLFTIIVMVVIFAAAAWLLSFISTLLSYGDFKLEVKPDEMVISRGIFEKKRLTIPYNRIQAVHISEGIIRQPLGYASVHIESAGYGDDKGTGSIVLFPLMKRDELLLFLNDILPDYQKLHEGVRPPARAARRYMIRASVVITAITAALYWLLSLNNWVWIIPALSVYWGWLRYRDAAAALSEDVLVIRSRQLAKNTAYIKRKRIQDATISQSWIQCFRNLCTVTVHVASGDQGKSFSVTDLEAAEGRFLLKELKGHGMSYGDLQDIPAPEFTVKLPGWPHSLIGSDQAAAN
ncbi:PH domain-containing protein [Rhodohalobacter mucosus]|nr:PH domain-containing protein [Rhodohalobacter mucosus]